ncbi:MAG: ATP synthase subunit I [bacterium]|nr:MAG: ATP synthase subunit I [bacterium]
MSAPQASFSGYVRQIFFRTLALVLVVAGLLILAGKKPWARGVALGGAVSLVNLLLMARSIPGQALALGGKVFGPAAARYALRMAVTAVALAYAGLNENIALGGAIPALFSAQVMLFAGEFIGKDMSD